jgi:hypothetical protein
VEKVDIRDLSNTSIALIIIMLFASVFTVRALTVQSPQPEKFELKGVTWMTVDPQMTFIMLPNEIHVKDGETFTVMFYIQNVEDMFAWQVYVLYDPTVLECLGVSFSVDYLLASKVTVSGALTSYDSVNFPSGPLQRVDNSEGWVLAGDCLLGADQEDFHGSGTLCQIHFKAISLGASPLVLSNDLKQTFQTYILNYDLKPITSSSPVFSNVLVTSS